MLSYLLSFPMITQTQTTAKATSPSLTSPSPRTIHHDASLNKPLSSSPQNLSHQRHLSFQPSHPFTQHEPHGALASSPYPHGAVQTPSCRRATSAPLTYSADYRPGKDNHATSAYAFPPVVYSVPYPTSAYPHPPYDASAFIPAMTDGSTYPTPPMYHLHPVYGWQGEPQMSTGLSRCV